MFFLKFAKYRNICIQVSFQFFAFEFETVNNYLLHTTVEWHVAIIIELILILDQ